MATKLDAKQAKALFVENYLKSGLVNADFRKFMAEYIYNLTGVNSEISRDDILKTLWSPDFMQVPYQLIEDYFSDFYADDGSAEDAPSEEDKFDDIIKDIEEPKADKLLDLDDPKKVIVWLINLVVDCYFNNWYTWKMPHFSVAGNKLKSFYSIDKFVEHGGNFIDLNKSQPNVYPLANSQLLDFSVAGKLGKSAKREYALKVATFVYLPKALADKVETSDWAELPEFAGFTLASFITSGKCSLDVMEGKKVLKTFSKSTEVYSLVDYERVLADINTHYAVATSVLN